MNKFYAKYFLSFGVVLLVLMASIPGQAEDCTKPFLASSKKDCLIGEMDKAYSAELLGKNVWLDLIMDYVSGAGLKLKQWDETVEQISMFITDNFGGSEALARSFGACLSLNNIIMNTLVSFHGARDAYIQLYPRQALHFSEFQKKFGPYVEQIEIGKEALKEEIIALGKVSFFNPGKRAARDMIMDFSSVLIGFAYQTVFQYKHLDALELLQMKKYQIE